MVGPFPYIGGKNRLAKQIVEIFPQHKTYVEAFAGGARVLFHKEASPVEVLNDLDGEIVNFFRVCQSHYEELLRYLRFMLASRKWFELLRATGPEGLTDIQRAARHLYLQKNSFASMVRHPSYHWHVVQPPGFNPERLPAVIESTHKRLERVQIECLPYGEVFAKFDRRETLFFCDPPYFGKTLYRHNFTTEDFVKFEQHLGELRGKFVLSLNDVPEVRTLFHRFHIRPIELAYTVQKKAGKKYREVLITNFKP